MKKKYTSFIKKILFYVFFLAVIYFFWKTLYQNFDALDFNSISINFWYLTLSFIFYIIFFLSLTLLWRNLLFSNLDKKEKKSINSREIIYINSVSWISKYIPGKISMILTKVLYLKNKFNTPKRITFISCLYEHIFQVITSFLLSFPFIIYYFQNTSNSAYVYLSALSFVGLLIFIHPYIFNRILNIVLRFLKKEAIKEKNFLSLDQIYQYILWYSFSMILKWISFLFLVMSISNLSLFSEVSFYIFAWIFAGVIWIISLFAPNGLWVREWVLVFLLQFVIWLELAIIISIFSRLWFSICDVWIGMYVGYEKYVRQI